MRALVLSGGGRNGSYQVGALKHLLGERGVQYDVICGVSVGAINGAHMAQFPKGEEGAALASLEELWGAISDRRVFRHWYRLGKLGDALGVILGKPSVYDTSPLWRFIDAHIDRDRIVASGHKLCVGAVEVGSWEYRTFTEADLSIVDAVKASSAFPIFFRPVEIDGGQWVDGGVRNITPLAEAIHAGATRVDVLMCSLDSVEYDAPKMRLRHLMGGVLDTLLSEIDRNDVKISGIYNDLAAHDPDCGKRVVDIRIMRPKQGLGPSLEFSPARIRMNMNRGYADARAFDWGS